MNRHQTTLYGKKNNHPPQLSFDFSNTLVHSQSVITAGLSKPFYPLCRQPGHSRGRTMRLGLLTPFLPALPVLDLRGHILLQRLELLRSLLRLLVGQT